MRNLTIVESNIEPNKEHLWLYNGNIKYYSSNGWVTLGSSDENIKELDNKIAVNQKRISAVEGKNTEQDTRLDNIEARIDPDIAGRVWNEDNGTPKAESYYGSVKALRDLPKRLGLGRYLVTDDRKRKKLDPKDSRKYLDGSPAKLDGSEGQCMWCWNGFYANIWHEGSRLIKAVTFDGPVGGETSVWIPAGGISWLGAGVMDRTNKKLCSLISDAEQYRGGSGAALNPARYAKAPAADSPQITMPGMPATDINTINFGNYARKRGQGWEANWFVARFVVEFLFEIIMGTENSQAAFNAEKDDNGLYQGGFGTGVTDMPEWGGKFIAGLIGLEYSIDDQIALLANGEDSEEHSEELTRFLTFRQSVKEEIDKLLSAVTTPTPNVE